MKKEKNKFQLHILCRYYFSQNEHLPNSSLTTHQKFEVKKNFTIPLKQVLLLQPVGILIKKKPIMIKKFYFLRARLTASSETENSFSRNDFYLKFLVKANIRILFAVEIPG